MKDDSIIDCFKKNENNYVVEAHKLLPGRSKAAIRTRFHNSLCERPDVTPYNIMTSKNRWTTKEEDVIIDCFKKNENNYCVEAYKLLPGRTKAAIKKRFNKHLIKRFDVTPYNKMTSVSCWTTEKRTIEAIRVRYLNSLCERPDGIDGRNSTTTMTPPRLPCPITANSAITPINLNAISSGTGMVTGNKNNDHV